MSKFKPLTEQQQQFIIDNRLQYSVNKMGVELCVGCSRIRRFMAVNNLVLTDEENKARRKKHPQSSGGKGARWVKDPWNYGLNLVTMQGGL